MKVRVHKKDKLIEYEAEKVTLNIIQYKGFNMINGMHIDEKWMNVEDFENMTFFQVFSK